MFTLHHGFWMYFFSRSHRDVWQFVVGSMLPDYIYGVLFALLIYRGQLEIRDIPDLSGEKLMVLLPLHPWVVKVDLIGHSVVFWGIAMLLVLLPLLNKFQAFIIGWGSHLLFDAFTHAAHANFYLYPLSMSAVHSPVSYWEQQYFAKEFGIVNTALMSLALAYLIGRKLYCWWQKKKRE